MEIAAGTSLSMASPAAGSSIQGANEKELRIRWAEAFDCWVNAPGSSEPIYTCPQPKDVNVQHEKQEGEEQAPNQRSSSPLLFRGTNQWPQAVRNLTKPIFGMSACDPCGVSKSDEENAKASAALEQDLMNMMTSSDSSDANYCWWYAFGFGKDWQEKGFVVSCPHDFVMNLARKYGQGAIYEFEFSKEDDHVVIRKTVPVLLHNVEADVAVITCSKPPVASSDPNYGSA